MPHKTKDQQIELGVWFLRSEPCAKGHEPIFWAKSGLCVDCNREAGRKYRAKRRAKETESEKNAKAEYMHFYSKARNSLPEVRQKARELERKYYAIRKDHFKKKNEKYRKSRPDLIAYHAAKSRRGKKCATPSWLTDCQQNQIKHFYELARDCFITSGQKYHVDHIVPLNGKNVCGLHVPWNLQILPEDLNISKKNKHDERNTSWI